MSIYDRAYAHAAMGTSTIVCLHQKADIKAFYLFTKPNSRVQIHRLDADDLSKRPLVPKQNFNRAVGHAEKATTVQIRWPSHEALVAAINRLTGREVAA